jgi:hypothetical protein
MSGLDKITFSPIRDKPRDKETTKQFVKDIDKGMYSYAINTGFYGPGIVALRANPEMLEFILIDGTRTIIVHSPVGYIFQNFNAEQVCRETDFVVGLLNACFNVKNSDNDKIGEHVNVVTSDNVLKMCNEAEVRKEETPIFTNPSPFSSIHYEEAASAPNTQSNQGGSNSRRTRRRKHRHNRKSHHKHARKTHHKRKHHSHSRSRSHAVRKHKKYTYRRRK